MIDLQAYKIGQKIGKLSQEAKQFEQVARDQEMQTEMYKACLHDAQAKNHVLEKENHALSTERDSLAAEKDALNQKLRAAEHELKKANETIRVQGKQILHPKDGRVYDPYFGSENAVSAPHPIQTSFEMVPYGRGRSRNRSAHPSPYFTQPMTHGPVVIHKGPQRKLNHWDQDKGPVPEMPTPYVDTQYYADSSLTNSQQKAPSGVALQGFHGKARHLGVSFTKLFNSVQGWAEKFTNTSTKLDAKDLPTATYDMVCTMPDSDETISLLISDQRCFAITKMVSWDISTVILQQNIVKGFSAYDAVMIKEHEKKIVTGIPRQHRRSIYVALADIVDKVTRDPKWSAYVEKSIERHVTQIWPALEPLVSGPQADPNEAWGSLIDIWTEAVEVGLAIQRSLSIWVIEFTPTGIDSFFNAATMTNVDPEYKTQDPRQLGRMGLKVRYSIAPVVTMTSFADLNVKPEPVTVCSGRVLLVR